MLTWKKKVKQFPFNFSSPAPWRAFVLTAVTVPKDLSWAPFLDRG